LITKQVGIQRIIDTIVVIENLRLRLGFTGDEGAVPSMIFLSSFWVVTFIGKMINKIITSIYRQKEICPINKKRPACAGLFCVLEISKLN